MRIMTDLLSGKARERKREKEGDFVSSRRAVASAHKANGQLMHAAHAHTCTCTQMLLPLTALYMQISGSCSLSLPSRAVLPSVHSVHLLVS